MNVIKEYRKAKGFSQTDLAYRCNVSLATIKRWERNTTAPTLHDAAKIYQVLRIPLTKLIEEYK